VSGPDESVTDLAVILGPEWTIDEFEEWLLLDQEASP